ncbi:MAG: hypothetical protein ABWY82_25865 [Tardiphaga sp.]|jgi:hypothetical protein
MTILEVVDSHKSIRYGDSITVKTVDGSSVSGEISAIKDEYVIVRTFPAAVAGQKGRAQLNVIPVNAIATVSYMVQERT